MKYHFTFISKLFGIFNLDCIEIRDIGGEVSFCLWKNSSIKKGLYVNNEWIMTSTEEEIRKRREDNISYLTNYRKRLNKNRTKQNLMIKGE